MKKVLKVIGWILGIYAIFDILCLAAIGTADILECQVEDPECNSTEIVETTFIKTEAKYKKWWKFVKG